MSEKKEVRFEVAAFGKKPKLVTAEEVAKKKEKKAPEKGGNK